MWEPEGQLGAGYFRAGNKWDPLKVSHKGDDPQQANVQGAFPTHQAVEQGLGLSERKGTVPAPKGLRA